MILWFGKHKQTHTVMRQRLIIMWWLYEAYNTPSSQKANRKLREGRATVDSRSITCGKRAFETLFWGKVTKLFKQFLSELTGLVPVAWSC